MGRRGLELKEKPALPAIHPGAGGTSVANLKIPQWESKKTAKFEATAIISLKSLRREPACSMQIASMYKTMCVAKF